MYSYSLGMPSTDADWVIPEPFYDEKTKLLFQSRGIPISVSMKDYYSFVNAMVTLGVAFPNASGRSAKPKIRDTFNSDNQFIVKDYNLDELTYAEMMDNLPEFLAFVNFVKYIRFLRSLKERKLKVTDSVATTEISYVNNTIHLFNMMRGMTTGKIALETPNGTVCLDTLKTDEAIVEPLRNKVDDAYEILEASRSHIETIRKEYLAKEEKLRLEMRKHIQQLRTAGFKESFNVMKAMVSAGFEVIQDKEYLRLVWKGHQPVTHVTLPVRYICDDLVTEEVITIPLPKDITDKLYVDELQLWVDSTLKIASASGIGKHPHLSGGSFCLGSIMGRDIMSAPSAIYSISTCNMSSFGGGAGRGEIIDYCNNLRNLYHEKDYKALRDAGVSEILLNAIKKGEVGTVFGKVRKDEVW